MLQNYSLKSFLLAQSLCHNSAPNELNNLNQQCKLTCEYDFTSLRKTLMGKDFESYIMFLVLQITSC